MQKKNQFENTGKFFSDRDHKRRGWWGETAEVRVRLIFPFFMSDIQSLPPPNIASVKLLVRILAGQKVKLSLLLCPYLLFKAGFH